jgi:hypothetical protein
MAKKKNKRKQTIRIFFRDGKKDVIPQKLWDDYEVIAKDSGVHLVIIKNEQWIAGYNLKDVTAWVVG